MRLAMQRHESVEHGGTFALRSEPERDTASGLEAAELASQLVALLLAEALHVRFEAVGKGQAGRGDEAIDLDVPAPVITLSLLERLRSRDTESFSDKLVSAMRNQFGGHEIKKE